MKQALQKSPIPESRLFVIRDLQEPHFDPNWHFHPEYQLFVVLEGTGTRFVGDHVKSFEEGDMVFTGPNLPHLWHSSPAYFDPKNGLSTRGIVIYFQESFPGQDFIRKDETIRLRQLFERSRRGLEIYGTTARKVRQNMLELLHLDELDSIILLLQILNTLLHSEEMHELSSAGYSNALKEGDTEIMKLVHSYVMDHFTRKISLAEVAAIANMTPTSFSRYFKLHANKTFSELLSEIRIGHACRLLIEEKMNVSLACYESGFQTLSNFNRQFKAIMKRTPLEYKKQWQQNTSVMS
ncbi:MAG: AraC family transcriptional regulator [Cyclobacteriaceae bacterium]